MVHLQHSDRYRQNNNIQPVKGTSSRRRIDGLASLLDAYVVFERHREDYMNLI